MTNLPKEAGESIIDVNPAPDEIAPIADGSLTGEDNPQTHKIVNRFGGYVYRRYREYWLDL